MPDVSKGMVVKTKQVRSDIFILEHIDIPKNNLIEPIQQRGAYNDISSFKVKENCWAFVTATVYTTGRGASGSDTDSVAGSSSSYSYWQPLGKGSRWYLGARGITYSYIIYPILK